MAIGGSFPNYQKVMDFYGAATKKEYKNVIAHAAQQANFRCSFNEAKGGVKRANIKDAYLGNSADPSKWNKSKFTKKGKKRKGSGQNSKEKKMWFALAAKQGAKKSSKEKQNLFPKVKVAPNDKKRTQVGAKIKNISDNGRHLTKAAATIRNRRRSRKGAIAAGFFASAKKAGLKNKAKREVQPIKGGSASRSVYHSATDNNLKAFTINKVSGSFEIGRRAMVRAVSDTMDDMVEYAQKKLNKIAEKAARQSSGRTR